MQSPPSNYSYFSKQCKVEVEIALVLKDLTQAAGHFDSSTSFIPFEVEICKKNNYITWQDITWDGAPLDKTNNTNRVEPVTL